MGHEALSPSRALGGMEVHMTGILNISVRENVGDLSLQQRHGSFGSRSTAHPIRRQVEQALQHGDTVVIDFDRLRVTQSFVDEIIGMPILQFGSGVLRKMSFQGCSVDVQEIIKFVVSDRDKQHRSRLHHV